MVRSRLRLASARCLTVVLALAVAAPLLGCNKEDLVETTFPGEGVELRYDLKPGATFDGKVGRKEVLSSRGQTMNRSIRFTVQLIVNEVDAEGNAKVAATVSNIELNWVIPDMPISMNEFNAKAKERLEGVTIRFSVDPSGKVFDIPPTPPELDEAESGVLDSVIEGLTSAFFVVPSGNLGAGETWEDEDTRGREGKLGKYMVQTTRGSLVGMFERGESKQQVAKLEINTDKNETTTTKDGSSEIRTRGKTMVLFDTNANYMTAIDSRMTRSQGPTVTTVDFIADWTRSIAGSGAAAKTAPPEAKVQSISDPCDDNYVGPNDCEDPCNMNYMGDAACEAAGDEAAGDAAAGDDADATADAAAACSADTDCGDGESCDAGACVPAG